MGNFSSKAHRLLPSKTRTSLRKGEKLAENDTFIPPHQPRAGETRDKDIEADGKDPHLLANLSKIGQVKINNAAATMKMTNQITEAYRAQDMSEQEALSEQPIRNRLTASTLSNLLGDRKFATSEADLERLAALYTIDIDVLRSIGRFVNTPSIEEPAVRTINPQNGDEKVTIQVSWMEPTIQEKS